MKKISPAFITEFINSRNKREKILFIFLFWAFLLGMNYLLLMQPVINLVFNEFPHQKMLKEKIRIMEADRKSARTISQQYEEVLKRNEEARSRFVRPDGTPELLNAFSQTATQSHVRILAVTPLEETKPENLNGFMRLPIQVEALAGTHELGDFLVRLESGPFYFKVIDINISSNPDDETQHRVLLKLETFRQVQSDGAKKI